jgi:DNA-binding MarR family transcriptional regulator
MVEFAESLSRAELQALQMRPSFLLRRAHQIAVSIFLGTTRGAGLTDTQYVLMQVLRARPGVDQAAAARLAGLDRSTTGLVLAKLESSGLVARPSGADRRRRALVLTAQGVARLQAMAASAAQAEAFTLAPLDAAEQAQFIGLLARLASAHNTAARAPLAAE